MRAECRHQAAGAALRAVLVTIRESSFQSNMSDSPALGPQGASRRTLPSATLVLGTSVPEPTVFRLKFCSDVLRYATTSRRNFVCDAWDRGALPANRKRAPHAVTAKWSGAMRHRRGTRSIAPSPTTVKLSHARWGLVNL